MLTSLKHIKMLAVTATVAATMACPAGAQDRFTVTGVHVDARAETTAAARASARATSMQR